MESRASQFMLFAYLASAQGSLTFLPHSFCEWLKVSHAECDQMLWRLQGLGMLERLANGEARLTQAGTVLGAQLRGDQPPASPT